jgi:hypothetical protein
VSGTKFARSIGLFERGPFVLRFYGFWQAIFSLNCDTLMVERGLGFEQAEGHTDKAAR